MCSGTCISFYLSRSIGVTDADDDSSSVSLNLLCKSSGLHTVSVYTVSGIYSMFSMVCDTPVLTSIHPY